MKKYYKRVLIRLILLTLFYGIGNGYAVDYWLVKANIPGVGGRSGAVGFSIGNYGYVGMGGSALIDFWEFDPVANSWTQKADFAGTTPRIDCSAFVIGNKGYVGLGDYNSTYFQDFWEFDPIANTWTQKINFGGIGRMYAIGLGIGNKGYFGIGSAGSGGLLEDFWEYDPIANYWTQVADFGGHERFSAVAFTIGNKGYVGTGDNSNFVPTRDIWEYDNVNNSWTQKALFPHVLDQAVSFTIGNRGYICTGTDGAVGTQELWTFDPQLNIWIQKATFPGTPRWGAVGFAIGNKGYVGTGGGTTSDMFEYNPDSIFLSVNELTDQNNLISVFPNPTNKTFTLKITSAIENELVQIFNTNGQNVFSKKLDGMKDYLIDIELAKGIYFVEINNKKNLVRKLIVE